MLLMKKNEEGTKDALKYIDSIKADYKRELEAKEREWSQKLNQRVAAYEEELNMSRSQDKALRMTIDKERNQCQILKERCEKSQLL